MTFDRIIDSVLGQPIRSINSLEKSIFLTFDDGPEPGMTERVLDALDAHDAKATFFVIAEKAKKYPNLLREIQRRSHSIGNHSLDHRFTRYFKGKTFLVDWIKESEDILSDIMGHPTIGFRSPWGVRTPALKRALKHLNMPLILWNTRFYDAVSPWTPQKALESLQSAQSGAILLLHDRQSPDRIELFLDALKAYMGAAKKAGFELQNLTSEMTGRSIC